MRLSPENIVARPRLVTPIRHPRRPTTRYTAPSPPPVGGRPT